MIIVGGTSVSTGALINNSRSDGTPYVLTSAHCVNNLFRLLGDLTSIHRNASTTVFFFGFQSPLRQGNVRPTEEQSLSGANLVGYSETSEMCLLRITGLPRRADGSVGTIPAAYQPTSLAGVVRKPLRVRISVSTIQEARRSVTAEVRTPSYRRKTMN